MNQPQLDFTPHRQENNAESQRHLDANRWHFNKKCAEVYRRLMACERLTVLDCANQGIASLPRRIKDLKEQGVCVSDVWENGAKVYFLTNFDLCMNRYRIEGERV